MQVVIIGAGYAGLTTTLRLARTRYVDRIILINDRPEHQLTTQLHRVAAGALAPDMATLSLERLLKGADVQLVIGRVASIKPDQSQVALEDGAIVPYDRLVVALGSQLEAFGTPGVFEYALRVQPLDEALRIRDHVAARLQHAAVTTGPERTRALRFAIVGGGLTGVELAGELADQLPGAARAAGIDANEIVISLMEAGPRLLPGLTPELAVQSAAVLARKGVDVRTNTAIKAVTPHGVVLNEVTTPNIANEANDDEANEANDDDPGFWPADTVVWTAGVRGHQLTESAFRSGARGRALVDQYLRAVDYPDVYILGDNALAVSLGNDGAAAPTAQNAVQQAAVAAENIAAEARILATHAEQGGIERPTQGEVPEVPAPTAQLKPYISRPLGIFVSIGHGEAVGELAVGDFWRPRLSGMPAYALKWASEQRYKLGIGAARGA